MVHVSFTYNRENRLYRSVWRFLIVFMKIYRGSNKFRDIHLEKKKKKRNERKKLRCLVQEKIYLQELITTMLQFL